jgi:hypothetical protein
MDELASHVLGLVRSSGNVNDAFDSLEEGVEGMDVGTVTVVRSKASVIYCGRFYEF